MSLTRQSRLLRPLAAPLTLLLLAACAVGPNFKRPAAPPVSDYTAHPQSSTVATADTAGGAAQRFAKGGDLAADWWTLFHSAALNALIDQSLERNPDLKAARAALSVARENVLAQRGVFLRTDHRQRPVYAAADQHLPHAGIVCAGGPPRGSIGGVMAWLSNAR